MKLLLAILALGTVGSLQAKEPHSQSVIEEQRAFLSASALDGYRPYRTGMSSVASSYGRWGGYTATTPTWKTTTYSEPKPTTYTGPGELGRYP